MIVTKKRLVKEAVNTLMEMDTDSFFELESATFTVIDLFARIGIDEYELIE